MEDDDQNYVPRIVVLKHSLLESSGELLKIEIPGYHPQASKSQSF